VPDDFVGQLPDAANPPTLLLPLMALTQALDQHNKTGEFTGLLTGARGIDQQHWTDFLSRAWSRLFAWYQWLEKNQAGPQAGSFRYAFLPCRPLPLTGRAIRS
jgi:hypothetical protein